jgi:DNA-binding protein WhiA
LYSHDAKDEIASVREHRTCCAATFVEVLQRFGKTRRDGALLLATAHAATARAFVAAAHAVKLEAHVSREPGRVGARWDVTLERKARERPLSASAIPRKVCCRRALLRAAFLACGSVSDPARGYHLELACRTDDLARAVSGAIGSFGGDAGLTRRRGRALVYVKDAQTVSMLLANMGATRALLRLEEHRALRQTKNSIRRTVNSEAANAARTAASAARQREAARSVLAGAHGRRISNAVREAARLRIAYPTRTLAELARAARPAITKAAMANRMRLLERLSKR